MIDQWLKDHINRATIELSSLCNYAPMHKKCYAHAASKSILPRKIITNILTDMESIGFAGCVAFHCYNEPMIDPRLQSIIEQTKKTIPTGTIHIWTNAWYTSHDLLCELVESGVSRFTLSAYTEAENERIREMVKGVPCKIKICDLFTRGLDGRNTTWADGAPRRYRRCYAPFNDLMHRADGSIGLCCYDCQKTTVFGNLYDKTWHDIMHDNFEKMQRIFNNLSEGNRSADCIPEVCRHCRRGR